MTRIYQFLYTIAKILLLAQISVASIANATDLVEFDDWVAGKNCSQNSSILCNGCYQPLALPSWQTNDPAQPIKITADSANLVAKGTSVFSGNVVATRGDKTLCADKATVLHDQSGELQTISAIGHVKLMQPGMRVDGTKATAYIPEKREVIENAVYRIYGRHARGEAAQAIIEKDSKLILKKATYTTCAPSSNAWYLYAGNTVLNKETGRGTATNAAFFAKDVPIFYFPYVTFPIDKRRQSGTLQPEFENTSLNGKTLRVPYYWNMAPNYDATITTNYMSLRGFKFDTVFRYLTRNSFGALNFDFLPQDRAYRALRNDLYNDSAFMTSTSSDTIVRRNDVGNSNFRYRVAAKDVTYINPEWLFTLDFTEASDGNYLYEFQPNSPSYVTDRNSSLYALQRVCLQNFNAAGTLRAQIERYQTFHVVNGPSGTEQLTKLPALDFNSRIFTLPSGFETYANISYINFRPNVIPDIGMNLTYGQRTHIRAAIAYPMLRPGWFIEPRAQINYVQYDHLNVSPADLTDGITPGFTKLAIPMLDLKTGMIFERQTQLLHMQFLQTLEPQLYYLYVPRKNQNNIPNLDSGLLTFDYNQVFRDNRYTGGDYIGDANQLGIGIASRFYNSSTGEEQGMLGVGKIKYFRNIILLLDQELDNTSQHWSPWAIVAKLRIAPNYYLEGNVVTSNKSMQIASVQLQYRPSDVNVLNLSYEYLQDAEPDDLTGLLNSNLNQVGISTAWQIAPPWRLLGKINYDLRFHRFLQSLAGFEYHTCCTAVRLVWCREWLSEVNSNHGHDNILRLQFIFKGFGSIGTAADQFIASMIPGYKAMNF